MIKTIAQFIENQQTIKHVGDAAAAFITVGTILKYLPAVAAVFTIFWTGMRILEMFGGEGSISKWWKKRR